MTVAQLEQFTDLDAFIKARAATDGSDTVTWFAGDVQATFPGQPAQAVFAFEGYNIARAVPADGGWDLLSREAVFYLDPRTREPLDAWDNPFTGERVDVVHVWNDPVNFPLRHDGPRGPFSVVATRLDDQIILTSDVFLTYPSPLPRADFPRHSQSDLYQAAELFQFISSARDLADDSVTSAPAIVSWTRIAPWVPFMAMGDRPGSLVYHCQGGKLSGGFDDLPSWIIDRIQSQNPVYATAPREATGPNESSWTYFRKLAEADPELLALHV